MAHWFFRSRGLPARLTLAGVVLAGTLLAGSGCSSSEEEISLSALHYFRTGNAAFQAEDYGRAVTHYRKALEFEDSAPDIHYNLGLAYYRVNAYRKAMESFRRAVALDPEFAEAQYNLALAYDKLYDMDSANRHFNRYRSLVVGKAEPNSNASGGGIGGGIGGGTGAGQPGAKRPAGKEGGKNAARIRTAGPPAAAPGQAAKAPPARRRLKKPANDPAGDMGRNAALPNPFQGNGKWWIQDTATQNR